jgi:lipooligosaccharide transport system permease protein
VLARLNPLHHCVELVRAAVFGWQGWAKVVSVAVLVAFGLATWRTAVRGMTRRLVT